MEFHNPKYLTDAFEVLDQSSDSIVICAGLTHLLRFYADFPFSPGNSAPEGVVHIGDLHSLAEMKEENNRYSLGATASVTDIENDSYLSRYAPAIWEAARTTSTPQIRNRRTLGGEVAWGSFHSPLIAALSAFDAEVRVRRVAQQDQMAHEENIDLAEFYVDSIERRNSAGQLMKCRKADLATRDLIQKLCIPHDRLRRPGTFSFFRALNPKISTENSGVVVAVHGQAQNGVLTRAQFVASGVWMSTLKDEIPLEGTKLKPGIFFERLFHFCDRYPIEPYRLSGPSAKQLGQIVFGLLKDGFSYMMGAN